jgi:hypothetical protein
MRSARVVRRSIRSRDSRRPLPLVSRMTIRPSAQARPADSARLGAALRASREAIDAVQRQLDALLKAVRSEAGRPAPEAAERLRHATRRADAAMERLVDM